MLILRLALALVALAVLVPVPVSAKPRGRAQKEAAEIDREIVHAMHLRDRGELDAAITLLQGLIGEHPDAIDPHRLYQEIAVLSRRNPRLVEAEYRHFLADAPDDPRRLLLHASARMAAMVITPEMQSRDVVREIEQQPPGIRWIELNADADPEGARRFKATDPIIGFAPILNGVPSSLGRWGTCGTSLYTTTATTDAGFVYQLAKWLDENWPHYRDLHSWNRFMTRELLLRELERTFLPCHEGLVAYLDELGLWTVAHQRRQDANAALVERYCQAYQGALRRADAQQVPVGPESAAWLEIWADCRRKAELPGFRMFLGLEDD